MSDLNKLLEVIKNHRSELLELYEYYNSENVKDDGVYRFYHQSFKVYFRLQPPIESFMNLVKTIANEAGDLKINDWFLLIAQEALAKKFDLEVNKEWLKHTRPICEAFFHCAYFLEMMVKTLDMPNANNPMIDSSFAAVLYLFGSR